MKGLCQEQNFGLLSVFYDYQFYLFFSLDLIYFDLNVTFHSFLKKKSNDNIKARILVVLIDRAVAGDTQAPVTEINKIYSSVINFFKTLYMK